MRLVEWKLTAATPEELRVEVIAWLNYEMSTEVLRAKRTRSKREALIIGGRIGLLQDLRDFWSDVDINLTHPALPEREMAA